MLRGATGHEFICIFSQSAKVSILRCFVVLYTQYSADDGSSIRFRTRIHTHSGLARVLDNKIPIQLDCE